MKTFTAKHLKEIEKQIQQIEKEEKNELIKASKVIIYLEKKIDELKEFILNYEFKSEQEEISFFKEIKPRILSYLIYYMSIYKIEVNRPTGSHTTIETYLLTELDLLKRYFERNIEFYKYYRAENSHLDKIYFLRTGDTELYMNISCFYVDRDIRFSTGYDYKVAKIKANDFLELYLKSELSKLDKNMENYLPEFRETFTGSQADIDELINALYASKVFNHGNITLKRLSAYIGKVFNIDTGDIYHVFGEIRERKGSRTRFLDRLKLDLLKRMDEADRNMDN